MLSHTGGVGADVIDGGAGLDTVIVDAGDTVLSVDLGASSSGTGANSSVSGFDVVSNVDRSDGTTVSETIDVAGTASVVADGSTDITDVQAFAESSAAGDSSTTFKAFSVSDGIVTFSDADTINSPTTDITVDSSNLAGAVTALQAEDLGDEGASVGFAYDSTGNGTADALMLFTQGSDDGADGTLDTLVQLAGQAAVDALITDTNTAGTNDLFII